MSSSFLQGNTAVVGLQWGDEGKGKIVDFLTEHADVVVRYCGGANAGHTVRIGSEKYATHLLPVGIFLAIPVLSGNFVYTVKDGVAKVQPVKVDRTAQGYSVISEGLSGGESVVVDGQLLLSDGTRVEPRAKKAGA